MTPRTIGLCGAVGHTAQGVAVYCTRPADHPPDEHVAAIGPVGPGVPVLLTWPVVCPATVSRLR